MKVLKTGKYQIEVMRRWPAESGKAINEELLARADVPGASKAFRAQVDSLLVQYLQPCGCSVKGFAKPIQLLTEQSQLSLKLG